jgi:rod shape-determining protein MreB
MRKNYNLLIGEPTADQIKINIVSAAPVGEEREM